MLSRTSAALLLLLALLLAHPALARRKSVTEDHPVKNAKATLLSLDEGSTIVETAMESRFRSARDCSHFVHSVYARAGYPFLYATASTIYAGIPEFHHVKHPQPGDLVVWRGHAGIVTDPGQHEFFSVLSTGLRTDFYTSKYWKSRGHARFFRYKRTLANSGE